jgi:nicotinamidase-related amidase
MLIERENSCLLLVDVQERLLGSIHEWQGLLDRLVWMVSVAQRLGVPILACEQYPKGLGPTHAALRDLLPPGAAVAKDDFSCVAAGCFAGFASAARRQWVVCGIESHVCVLQSAIDLRGQGHEVFLVADAVGSRNPSDRELALARMRQHGIEIVSREMVVFEWLRRAGSDEFRTMVAEFLR